MYVITYFGISDVCDLYTVNFEWYMWSHTLVDDIFLAQMGWTEFYRPDGGRIFSGGLGGDKVPPFTQLLNGPLYHNITGPSLYMINVQCA